MLNFPPELVAHKGNVFSLLYMVGGLLMTVTAGSQCVAVAVRTAQDPVNLLRLSNTLIGLVGHRRQAAVVNSLTKRRVKRLYFTHSLCSFLEMMRTPGLEVLFPGPSAEERTNPFESSSAKRVAERRRRIHYVLLVCGASSRAVLALCLGNNGVRLRRHNPASQTEWLVEFSGEARGDVIFLLLTGRNGQTGVGSEAQQPTGLTLALSALFVVFIWTLLPYMAVCALICLGWQLRRRGCSS